MRERFRKNPPAKKPCKREARGHEANLLVGEARLKQEIHGNWTNKARNRKTAKHDAVVDGIALRAEFLSGKAGVDAHKGAEGDADEENAAPEPERRDAVGSREERAAEKGEDNQYGWLGKENTQPLVGRAIRDPMSGYPAYFEMPVSVTKKA